MVSDMKNQMQTNEKYVYEQRILQELPDAHESSPSGRVNGAILAITSIQGAIPVLHGSAGCGFHYRFLCRRQKTPAYNLQCTNLTELELIFGSEDKLKRTIIDVYNKYHPRLIAIIPAVTAEIIHADIEGVIQELQPGLACKLIRVSASGISHADKRKIGKNYTLQVHPAEEGNRNGHDAKMNGCGFSDAMTSVVRQVMRPQKIIKRSINLSGIAWGITSDIYSDGIARELAAMGCTINARLPACTLKELETAPQAELNLLTYRARWAAEMEKEFGTPYFAADFRAYSSRGINGILEFYLVIAGLLNLSQGSMDHLYQNAAGAGVAITKAAADFAGKVSVLCCEDYRNLQSFLDFYLDTMHFDISCILLKVTDNGYLGMMNEEERLLYAERKVKSCLNERKLKARFYINPPGGLVHRILSDADYLLGSDCFQSEAGQAFYVEPPGALPLNLSDFQSLVQDYIQWIKKQRTFANSRSKLLSGKLLDYMAPSVSVKHDASRKMWDYMWLKRS